MSTLRTQRSNVRFWHKADIAELDRGVRQQQPRKRPLLTA